MRVAGITVYQKLAVHDDIVTVVTQYVVVKHSHSHVLHNWWCNYSIVLYPLSTIVAHQEKIIPILPWGTGNRTAQPASFPDELLLTLRQDPCVEEVDNPVNFPIYQGMTLWMTCVERGLICGQRRECRSALRFPTAGRGLHDR